MVKGVALIAEGRGFDSVCLVPKKNHEMCFIVKWVGKQCKNDINVKSVCKIAGTKKIVRREGEGVRRGSGRSVKLDKLKE